MLSQSSSDSSLIDGTTTLGHLAQQYLDSLLRMERHHASRMVLQAVEKGVTIKDIYLNVFQACQFEIGRLWQTGQVSVAAEHYCTAATQLIMSQLYPYVFNNEKNGRRLVATCVGGELHEIGVRMVADFFEMDGWDTFFLGASTPASSVLQTIEERDADVLAVSATITFNIGAVAKLISEVRLSNTGKDVKILVGGRPFGLAPALWQTIGADGSATDAQQAIAEADRLLA